MIELDFTNTDEVRTEFGWYRILPSNMGTVHFAHLEYRFATYVQSVSLTNDGSIVRYPTRDDAIKACQDSYRQKVTATIDQAYGKWYGIVHTAPHAADEQKGVSK